MYTYKLEDLVVLFNNAKELKVRYIGVAVETEGLEGKEVIITPIENFDKKLKFYQDTYDNELNHKFSKVKIKIIEFVYGNNYSEIERLIKEMIETDVEEETLYIKCRRNGFMAGTHNGQFCTSGDYYEIVNHNEDFSRIEIIDNEQDGHDFDGEILEHYFDTKDIITK